MRSEVALGGVAIEIGGGAVFVGVDLHACV